MATYYWNPLAAGHAWTDSVWSTVAASPVTPGTVGPPTAADTAIFSSNDTSNCAISSAAVCLDLSFTDTLGYTGTVSGSSTLAISGSLTLSAGVVWSYTGAITFNATATGKTITTAGVTLANNITFNGTGGGWTNQDNLSNGATNTITLTAGTWSTNAKTIMTGLVNLEGSTAARTAMLTNSTINVTGTGPAWSINSSTGLTRTLTGSTINISGAGVTFVGGSISTYNIVNFTNLSGNNSISNSNTFVTLSITGAAGLNNRLSFQATATNTVSGTLTLSGPSQGQRLWVESGTFGSNATLNAHTVAISNVDFSNITGAGNAAPFTGTSIGDAGGNSQITATTPVSAYWVGNSGNYSNSNNWAASSGGSPGAPVPLPQDTANFDLNSFTLPGQTIIADEFRYGSISFAGVTNAPTFSPANQLDFYGSLVLAPSLTIGGGFTEWFWMHQTGTLTITSNGLSLLTTNTIAVNCPGGALQLVDALNVEGLALQRGTFDANNQNVGIGANGMFTNGTNTRALKMGTGTWTLSAPTGIFWDINSTGLTFTQSTSKILISAVPTGTRTFIGGGVTYYNFEWAAEGGVGSTFIVTGANTFNDFKVDPDVARTLQLPASTTQTMTTLELSGEIGELLTVNSSTSGTQATLSVSSGTVTGNYLSLRDSAATGGATFNAVNSVNVSNNTGWNFVSGPSAGGSGVLPLFGVGALGLR